MANKLTQIRLFPGSSMVKGYIIYFHKISSEVHLNIMQQTPFLGQNTGMFRVIYFILLRKLLTPVTSKLIG